MTSGEKKKFNLSQNALARKVGLTPPKTRAMIHHLKIENDPDCFIEIRSGKSRCRRYSGLAVLKILDALEDVEMEKVWEEYFENQKM